MVDERRQHGPIEAPAELDWLPGAFNQGWSYHDHVGPEEDGMGLVEFYGSRHRHSGASIWHQRLKNGEISRNGAVLRDDLELRSGDRLLWRRPPWWEGPVPGGLSIRFDDGDLLVIDKPSGLPVLPSGGWLEHTVLKMLERNHRGDPAGIPRPVHRLGRFTSGLLVCSRRPTSRAWLSAQLRDSTAQAQTASDDARAGQGLETTQPPMQPPRPFQELVELDRSERNLPMTKATPVEQSVLHPSSGRTRGATASAPCHLAAASWAGAHKLYRALLQPGRLGLAQGGALAVRVPIGRHRHPLLGQVWAAGGAGALPALSLLTLLEARTDGDLVEVAIQTGRPHQIRIHCAALGAPLLGDPLYRSGGLPAAEALPGDGGYQLHALALRLHHPHGGLLELWAPPPASLCHGPAPPGYG